MRLPRPLAPLVAAAVLVAPAAAAAQSSSGAGLGIRLLEAPSDRAEDPRANRYVVDHVSPGTAFERRIEVINDRPDSARVELYANAARVQDGSFVPLRRIERNELTSWITVEPPVMELQPRGRAAATVKVRVPADARAGEYYGVVFAELPGPRVASGASISSRTGIRVYLSVGDGEEPASDFLVESLQATRRPDGRPAVQAQIRNTGGRALDLSGSLALADGPGGLSAGPFDAVLGTTLAPGDGAPVEVVLDAAVQGGPWTATLTVRSGLLERQARAQVTFPNEAGANASPVEAENLVAAEDPKILVPIAGSLILLIAALLLWRHVRRPRLHQKQEELVRTG